MKVRSTGFNVKIVLLSRATGSVSSGNLSAFDIIGSKTHEIVGDETGNTQLMILLPMETGKLPVTTTQFQGQNFT